MKIVFTVSEFDQVMSLDKGGSQRKHRITCSGKIKKYFAEIKITTYESWINLKDKFAKSLDLFNDVATDRRPI